jgi:hypothetical protein
MINQIIKETKINKINALNILLSNNSKPNKQNIEFKNKCINLCPKIVLFHNLIDKTKLLMKDQSKFNKIRLMNYF